MYNNAIAVHRRQFSLSICSSPLVTLSSSSLLSKIHCYRAPILPVELVLIVVVMVVKMASMLELVGVVVVLGAEVVIKILWIYAVVVVSVVVAMMMVKMGAISDNNVRYNW